MPLQTWPSSGAGGLHHAPCNEWLSGVPMTQVDLLHGFDDESLAEDERVALAHAAVVGLTEALAGKWVSDAELDSALLDAPKL